MLRPWAVMAFSDYGTGSCINCGFLCKRHSDPSESRYYEATGYDRQSGHLRETKQKPRTIEWCFRGAANLKAETDTGLGDEDEAAATEVDACIYAVIKRGRQCPRWFQWQEGLDPIAHLGGLAMQEQEQEQRQRAFDLSLQRLNDEAEKRRERTQWFIAWVAIGLAVFRS